MSKTPEHNDNLTSLLQDSMERAMPPEAETRMRRHLAGFQVRLAERETPPLPHAPIRRLVLRAGWAVAGLMLFAVAVGYVFSGQYNPTWADVMERFASVPVAHATVYVRFNAISEPIQLELWMGEGSKVRMRAGNRMVFGEKGQVVDTVPYGPGKRIVPGLLFAEETVKEFIGRLGNTDSFSFETIFELIPDLGQLSVPFRNQEASIGNDLVVFDLNSETSPEWVRVWALRESRLPVRVQYWDPRMAQSIDVLLSYANRQPAEFFDPEAFKSQLASAPKNPADRAYALIEDAGGQPVTPQDARELAKDDSEPVGSGT